MTRRPFIPILLPALLAAAGVRAQECGIVITGDFEAKCLLPNEGPFYIDEYPQTLVACEGGTVEYTAYYYCEDIAIASWSWQVTGAASVSASGNVATVVWGGAGTGEIVVAITTQDGRIHYHTRQVRVIAPPVAHARTTPAMDPDINIPNTIYVCMGMSVWLEDSSYADGSDIVGYEWTGGGVHSTTRTCVLENVYSNIDVTHRVYNNCGCYDEEVIHIKVLYGRPLQLDCLGTVCQGSIVSYSAIMPTACAHYFWDVEGGTVVSGQYSRDFMVEWGSPPDGYGVISLNGSICVNDVCPDMLSVKVPVISDGVAVDGQTAVCEGEAVVYSVPLYGSTAYTWSVTSQGNNSPATPAEVSVIPVNGANKITCLFNEPGTYDIHAEYQCDFLGCGPFVSRPLTVTVKPRLEISGKNEVCKSNAAVFTAVTVPPDTLLTWTLYGIGESTPLYTSPTPEARLTIAGGSLTEGTYMITAQSPAYCNVAEFVFAVRETPPPPTVADLDPGNPTVACPYSGILLHGSTANPDYSLVWSTDCQPLSEAAGKEVTLTYGATVCDVNVYTYDCRLHCRSDVPYVHHVDEFQLEPVSLPQGVTTVCPGTVFEWTDADVPPQDGVIYEWYMEDQKQYCGAVVGGKYSNTATFEISRFSPPVPSVTFNLYLKRTYCSVLSDITVVTFHIDDLSGSTPAITVADTVCEGTPFTLTGTGCTGDYRWTFSDAGGSRTGNPLQHTFNSAGYKDITLSCNPYTFCDRREYYPSVTATVYARPKLWASIKRTADSVCVVPPRSSSDFTFQWGHTNVNNDTVAAIPGLNDYDCVITQTASPYCQTQTATPGVPSCGLLSVQQVGSINYCDRTVTFEVPNPQSVIEWRVYGHGTLSYQGQYNEIATVTLSSAGNFMISAQDVTSGGICLSGHADFTVDFLPFFEIEKHCTYIILKNKSKYLDNSKTVTLTVNNMALGTYPLSQSDIVCSTSVAGSYDFRLTAYDGQPLPAPCPIGSTDIYNSTGAVVTITTANTANPNATCDNTPLELTASIPPPHTIVRSEWVFADHNTIWDTTGVTVTHTFEHIPNNTYNVIVNITDENGCVSTNSLLIQSKENVFLHASLAPTLYSYPECPESPRTIEYALYGNPVQSSTTPYYHWVEDNITDNYPYHEVYHTADYHVVATNGDYCEGRAFCNVPFKSAPLAIIIPKKRYYCGGETVTLYGEPDLDNVYQYLWTVTDNATNEVTTYTDGTAEFTAVNDNRTYTVKLTVTNSEGCSASADPVTITVHKVPDAPQIEIASLRCIHEQPVELLCTDPQSGVMWSNGAVGLNAFYQYPGMASAWYYDPLTGCRSDSAVLQIPAAPDFDALLTGCYKVCPPKTFSELPVYGLLPILQPFGWDWQKDGNLIDDAGYPSGFLPLQLPLNGIGSYKMEVEYFEGCHEKSKELLLKDDECRCDSLDIDCQVQHEPGKCCHQKYDITVTVCNRSVRDRCFDLLKPLFPTGDSNMVITGTTFSGFTLSQNDCYTFHIYLDLIYSIHNDIAFRLSDNDCVDCDAVFSVNLMPPVSCTRNITSGSLNTSFPFQSNGMTYYNFTLRLPSVRNVVLAWSDHGNLTIYGGTAYFDSTVFNGFWMIDLRDLVGEDICINLLVCTDTGLCVWRYCETVMPPGGPGPGNAMYGGGNEKRHISAVPEETPYPRLVPNPATGDVYVDGPVFFDAVGKNCHPCGQAEEITVMDMYGRRVAAFYGTSTFNVARLPAGAYIVRIGVMGGEDYGKKYVHLKLIKK